jgi:hypothetical protein
VYTRSVTKKISVFWWDEIHIKEVAHHSERECTPLEIICKVIILIGGCKFDYCNKICRHIFYIGVLYVT